MKKLARILGILGGVAAVAWAMRDRFVSIAAPREPQPPTFRVVPPLPPEQTGDDDLTLVKGIGPVFAARLGESGITTFADLANTDVAEIARLAGVPESRASDWVEQASALV